ncbi:hypothetical protein CRM22_010400 [Opisthorchis felineus]|uniref:Uncharacterized protein n=1 Tax=Opisthorchis felineus TaxID=147828 RepID=A0A4S2L4G2_OPIFE|nr:hypothetical protein CRM22_010400 [Opisthorchis felineus]
MSVIFTTGKKSGSLVRGQDDKGRTSANPEGNLPAHSYIPSANTTVWNINLDGVATSMAFCKDSGTLWVNDSQIPTQERTIDKTIQHEFILADHKAQLTIARGNAGPDRCTLLVDGSEIKAIPPPSDRMRKVHSSDK